MKILVIDDEPLIHISIEKLIQACSKEDEVLHAYNGHEMLKMLEEHEIAMAYVDIKMPGPSGLEAIKLGFLLGKRYLEHACRYSSFSSCGWSNYGV